MMSRKFEQTKYIFHSTIEKSLHAGDAKDAELSKSQHPQTVPNDKMSLDDVQKVPRYLFRTYSLAQRGSMGQNNCRTIASQLAKNGKCGTDLLDMSYTAATQMIEDHLSWHMCPGDDLVSWTSSLLFALQHAIRRKTKDFPPPSSAEICICVIDTFKFDSGLFRSASALMQQFGISVVTCYNYKPEDLAHEYLTQGTLNITGKSATTSLESLIDAGMYELFPELETSKDFLYTRVLELRANFFASVFPTSDAAFARIKLLASKCFRDDWVWPLTIILLTLRRRDYKEIFSLSGIPLSLSGKDSEHLFEHESSKFGIQTPITLEVRQFARIWEILEQPLKTVVADEIGEAETSDNQDPDEIEALIKGLLVLST